MKARALRGASAREVAGHRGMEGCRLLRGLKLWRALAWVGTT